jgi:energy-coupling factor transporter ATP-binding protein EcfA2
MIESLRIQNYKSVADVTLELGRFNVLIGENGCGKTNILEALAFAAEGRDGVVHHEALYLRGVRTARPAITTSAFAGHDPVAAIQLSLALDAKAADGSTLVDLKFCSRDQRPEAPWLLDHPSAGEEADLSALSNHPAGSRRSAMQEEIYRHQASRRRDSLALALIADFAIYAALTPSLRGNDVISRRTPLGIHGEGLDVVIANLPPADLAELCERARCISWLGDLFVDKGDDLKLQGHKLGRSLSRLYFRDRFMAEDRDVFSAENANEGVLHVLFHLALLLAPGTPKVFGVDNFDTALNPRLCRELTKEMAALAKSRGRQCLVTTHNPAALDGLNLHDPDQRLFVISRDDEGCTTARRITLKPQPEGPTKFKLSELWMRGHLGGLPTHF